MKDADERFSHLVSEEKRPLDKVCKQMFEETACLFLFGIGRIFFDIIHQGMQAAYERISEKLTSQEKHLFRFYCLKNPDYLHRVIVYDPSPVVTSFRKMLGRVYEEVTERFGQEKANATLDDEMVAILQVAYLNFYPTYIAYLQDDEAQQRKAKEKRVHFEPWMMPQAGHTPDYMVDPLQEALARLSSPQKRRTSTRSQRSRRSQQKSKEKSFLTDRQRRISGLERTMKNKDIALQFGQTPGNISKIRKKIRSIMLSSWQEGVYNPLRYNHYRDVRKAYRKLSAQERKLFKHLYQEWAEEFTRHIIAGTSIDSEQFKKDMLPPFLRG